MAVVALSIGYGHGQECHKSALQPSAALGEAQSVTTVRPVRRLGRLYPISVSTYLDMPN
jgi:hypothetical protein